MEYCASVWNSGYVGDVNKIESVQRKVTKLCPALKLLSYSERLEQLGLVDLKERRNRGDMIMIFKLSLNNKNLFNKYFTLNSSTTRGHELKLVKHRVYILSLAKDHSIKGPVEQSE